MIVPAQIRAARGLLKWTQATLAHRASLSTVTLNMIENETVVPRPNTLESIQRALEQSGIEFLEEGGEGVGVRFQRQAEALDLGFDSGLIPQIPTRRGGLADRQ